MKVFNGHLKLPHSLREGELWEKNSQCHPRDLVFYLFPCAISGAWDVEMKKHPSAHNDDAKTSPEQCNRAPLAWGVSPTDKSRRLVLFACV